MIKLIRKPQAKADIKNIWRYGFDKWGMRQADNYIRDLGEAISKMPDNPMMGIAIGHIRRDYRQYHFKHHLIIYRFTKNTIDIIRVLSENMDVKLHV